MWFMISSRTPAKSRAHARTAAEEREWGGKGGMKFVKTRSGIREEEGDNASKSTVTMKLRSISPIRSRSQAKDLAMRWIK